MKQSDLRDFLKVAPNFSFNIKLSGAYKLYILSFLIHTETLPPFT